jgi:hypothetical protein
VLALAFLVAPLNDNANFVRTVATCAETKEIPEIKAMNRRI